MEVLATEAYGWLWLILLVVFLIVEASCPVHLVSIWFVVGCLAALVTDYLGGALWLQISVFVLVSGSLLALLWPLTKKYMKPKITATNVDSMVGTQGYVTEDIDNVAAHGHVKLGGMEWTARSTTGDPIGKDTLVRVDRIEGVKAFVTPVEAPAKV